MNLDFKVDVAIKVNISEKTIKELQEIFNRVRVVPKTYAMLCKSLKYGSEYCFEYGSEGHIYQYIQWVLERDLKPTLKDGLRDIAEDLVLYLDNKRLSMDVKELTVDQVVTCACKPLDTKDQEDNQLCLNI